MDTEKKMTTVINRARVFESQCFSLSFALYTIDQNGYVYE